MFAGICIQSATKKNKNGATQRQAVDQILTLVFEAKGVYSVEYVSMFVPGVQRSDASIRSETVVHVCHSNSDFGVATVKADCIVTGKYNVDRLDKLNPMEEKNARYSWAHPPAINNSVIVFAGEWKRDETGANVHRMIFDVTTAHHHRRAIGMPDSDIYTATADRGELTIWVSRWDDLV
jgi:hypothetical protein